MTTIKTVATHEIVRLAYPRPVTERDELGMAVGLAIDTALSQYSHDAGLYLRPTASSMNRLAAERLDQELRDADLTVSDADREKILAQVAGVLQAFRRSEVFGLSRPRSRIILINERVGVYAQPDYWDRRSKFYEMKSYRAVPPPPDVALQLTYFQLAFPGLAGYLVCYDRHSTPVETTVVPLPALSDDVVQEALRRAFQVGVEHGKEKVLEYVDSPLVRYSIDVGPAGL